MQPKLLQVTVEAKEQLELEFPQANFSLNIYKTVLHVFVKILYDSRLGTGGKIDRIDSERVNAYGKTDFYKLANILPLPLPLATLASNSCIRRLRSAYSFITLSFSLRSSSFSLRSSSFSFSTLSFSLRSSSFSFSALSFSLRSFSFSLCASLALLSASLALLSASLALLSASSFSFCIFLSASAFCSTACAAFSIYSNY